MSIVRIHPSVGVARVGNSTEYYLAPETMAGKPPEGGSKLVGGLPIRPGTESTPIDADDIRDSAGALKRQAARFRLFAYPEMSPEPWPRGDGTEIHIGSELDGRKVADIVWTVHVANKKTNWFVLTEDGPQGIASYDGRLPPLRNADPDVKGAAQPADPIATINDPKRIRRLVIDPGPRSVQGASAGPVGFDGVTPPSHYDAASSKVVSLPSYPKSFPADSFDSLDLPSGPIDTLGELRTDDNGRLIVVGGFGRAAGWKVRELSTPLNDDVNNPQWFDDTSDGPVRAVIVFDDGSTKDVQPAWVTTTDPAFAPQILNVVSMWDDVQDVWVRQLELLPKLYDGAKDKFRAGYKPGFEDQIAPIFRAAAQQPWVANFSAKGMSAHGRLRDIKATDVPDETELAGIEKIFRNPFDPQQDNAALMPMHLGDGADAFLTLRKTQYFFLEQWSRGHFSAGSALSYGAGELLDKTVLVNCIGGRLSPGIDLTFVMREPAIYVRPWSTSGVGPFRIRAKDLDYASAKGAAPLLTGGYVPRHVEEGLEPGDLSKFMALPWHTDYNSCATHPPIPNPPGNRTVFWSWPAQRPVAVYTASDIYWGKTGDDPDDPEGFNLGSPRWSIRGEGTDSPDAENWGRYQDRKDMLDNWSKIGVVVQASAIPVPGSVSLPDEWYLEVGGKLRDSGKTVVQPFPNLATVVDPADNAIDPAPAAVRELFYRLMNISDFPTAIDDARNFTDLCLQQAEKLSNDPSQCPEERLFFSYSDEAFEQRIDFIYQQLVDDANSSDPTKSFITSRSDIIERIIQFTPLNLLDGAWIRNISRVGPLDEVRSLLFSIFMDEMGDGDVSRNHCNIYLDLCHSVGYYPEPLDSREFAFDPAYLDSAFTVPTFELAISQLTNEYYPEIIGMTLQLEWEVVGLKPTRDLLSYFEIDPHFYVMHIGIDNAVNGHGQRAADAVRLYLERVRSNGGEVAVQAAWRRVWNGYVAFATLGTLAQDLKKLILQKPSSRDLLLELIRNKAEYGSRNHQGNMVGDMRIDDWFANPEGFLDALVKHEYLTPGDWPNSRLAKLLDFETGPMFRVFTDDEISLWREYCNALASPPPDKPPVRVGAAQGMALLIEQFRPVQDGAPDHAMNRLVDDKGEGRTIAEWFSRPPAEFMAALASPRNGLIVRGSPGNSRFVTDWAAPGKPMGAVFDQPASKPNLGTARDVLTRWISEGCPLPSANRGLLLSSPPELLAAHPTGRILGMGAVH